LAGDRWVLASVEFFRRDRIWQSMEFASGKFTGIPENYRELVECSLFETVYGFQDIYKSKLM